MPKPLDEIKPEASLFVSREEKPEEKMRADQRVTF